MANYYTQLCVKLPFEGEQIEAFNILVDRYSNAVDAQEGADFDFFRELLGEEFEWLGAYTKKEGDCLYILADESPNLEALGVLIQHFLVANEIKTPVGFEWACTCSKDRPDGFGGGAVFITPDNIEWLSTQQWLQERIK